MVVAGADRRGTVFGIYDLSRRIGVSPWHWWADVPVAREVQVTLSPTLDYPDQGGLRYAVAIGDEPPQTVNVHAGATEAEWNQAVADNRWVRSTRHRVAAPGPHVVRLWAVDPGLVFQRLVLVRGEVPRSYLGPPESRCVGALCPGELNRPR